MNMNTQIANDAALSEQDLDTVTGGNKGKLLFWGVVAAIGAGEAALGAVVDAAHKVYDWATSP
jgi:hypothetical protein